MQETTEKQLAKKLVEVLSILQPVRVGEEMQWQVKKDGRTHETLKEACLEAMDN